MGIWDGDIFDGASVFFQQLIPVLRMELQAKAKRNQ
jgi:hypothetical protein